MKFLQVVNERVSLEAVSERDDDYILEEHKELWQETRFDVFRVSENSRINIGQFRFSSLPGCPGIVVSHGTFLNKNTRGQGLSDDFRKLKERLAKELGYSVMIATVDLSNIPGVGNLMKSKYDICKTFRNGRSDHEVGFGWKVL